MKKVIVDFLPDCDICKDNGEKSKANYDARTISGVGGV